MTSESDILSLHDNEKLSIRQIAARAPDWSRDRIHRLIKRERPAPLAPVTQEIRRVKESHVFHHTSASGGDTVYRDPKGGKSFTNDKLAYQHCGPIRLTTSPSLTRLLSHEQGVFRLTLGTKEITFKHVLDTNDQVSIYIPTERIA